MLDRKRIEISNERSSRKEPLSDKEARELLKKVGKVIVARGKKSIVLPADKAGPADLRGPSGNYRAPMIRKGRTLVVGFNSEILDEIL